MSDDPLCAVVNCPAYAARGRKYCPAHAKALPAAFDSPCVSCRAHITRGDLVVLVDIGAGGTAQAHAVCPTPVFTRRVRRRDRKPLLSILED